MKPLEDWMVVQLYRPQAAKMDIQISLPDTIDQSKDESAAFEILQVGPGTEAFPVNHVSVGDIVIMYGIGAIAKMELPNRKKVFVGQARNVCFILEKQDLK